MSVGVFMSAVMAHVGKKMTATEEAVKKAALAERRHTQRERERLAFERQQADAIKVRSMKEACNFSFMIVSALIALLFHTYLSLSWYIF